MALAIGLMPAAAVAQNVTPTGEQYDNGVLNVGAGADPGDPAAADPTATSSGELPFTGLDVLAIAAIGVGLLGAGLAVRRISRTHGDQTAI